MMPGLYWEYLCVEDGFFPQEKIVEGNKEQEQQAKERLERRVKEHIEKFHTKVSLTKTK